MQEDQLKALSILRIPDPEIRSANDGVIAGLQSRLHKALQPSDEDLENAPEGETSSPGFVAIAPVKQVNLESEPDAPFLIAYRYSGMRQWEVQYEANMWIVESDLHSGSVRCFLPFTLDRRKMPPKPSASGPQPSALARMAVHTSVRRSVLTLPESRRTPAEVALTVIVYDWASNTATINLTAAPDVKPEELTPSNPSAFIRPAKTSASPLGFRLPPSASLSRPVPAMGSVDLKASRSPILPGGICRASIVLFRLDNIEPVIVDIRMPSSDPTFLMDLREAAQAVGQTLPKGNFRAYLVSGSAVSGPHPMELTE